jgi:hypothetical protein
LPAAPVMVTVSGFFMTNSGAKPGMVAEIARRRHGRIGSTAACADGNETFKTPATVGAI